jgi:hypothetical protein
MGFEESSEESSAGSEQSIEQSGEDLSSLKNPEFRTRAERPPLQDKR